MIPFQVGSKHSLVQMLTECGYTNLTVCTDGQDAWETIKAKRQSGESFDLALTDIEMPLIDGIEMAKKIPLERREFFL